MQKGKLDALTSLRFFAAAMIVIGHAHGMFGSAGIANTISLAQGVSFFFILSGFILAYNYPKLENKAAIGKFWLARFARIWPAHIAAILLLLCATHTSNMGALDPEGKRIAVVTNVLLIQSFIPLRDYFLALNGVAWSISTEFFFYAAFPLLAANLQGTWKWKLAGLAAVVVAFIALSALYAVPMDEANRAVNAMALTYVNPLVRVFEFFVGVLAYRFYARYSAFGPSTVAATMLEVLAVCLAVYSMWASKYVAHFFGWSGSFANYFQYYLNKSGSIFAFFALIIVFAFQKGMISRMFQAKLFVLLGEISFALYLVHTIVLTWFWQHNALPSLSRTAAYITFWAVCLAISYAMYQLVEKPCRKVILALPAQFKQWRDSAAQKAST